MKLLTNVTEIDAQMRGAARLGQMQRMTHAIRETQQRAVTTFLAVRVALNHASSLPYPREEMYISLLTHLQRHPPRVLHHRLRHRGQLGQLESCEQTHSHT
jgi:hypothetical protein